MWMESGFMYGYVQEPVDLDQVKDVKELPERFVPGIVQVRLAALAPKEAALGPVRTSFHCCPGRPGVSCHCYKPKQVLEVPCLQPALTEQAEEPV